MARLQICSKRILCPQESQFKQLRDTAAPVSIPQVLLINDTVPAVPIARNGIVAGYANPVSWHPGGNSVSLMDPADPSKPLKIWPYIEANCYLPHELADTDVVLTGGGLQIID